MVRALIIMHVENEGPGIFGEALEAVGAKVRGVRLHRGEALPSISEIDAALSMGGPMNVYEEERHQFLRAETLFLQEAAARDVPVLGICLGAQMIAKAAGAAVTKNRVPELGWGTVTLTDEGIADPLFRGLPRRLPVFQWHADTFAIPAGGRLLATGTDCRHQAFRFGRSLGLQFHLEADLTMLASWFSGTSDKREILRRYKEPAPEINRHARALFANFLDLARRPAISCATG